jgi:hypothetical protein
MSSGGARATSGPPKQEGSRTSDRAGVIFTALPAEGFEGDVPEFPLPEASGRELEIWVEAWSTPQACAWFVESWRWPTVAEFCRFKALCESEPNASLIGQLHRYREDLGLSAAGLARNGWKIGDSGRAAEEMPAPDSGSNVTSIKDRLNRGAS